MNTSLTISLNNLHFFAYHGLYAEEKKLEAEFEVNLSVTYIPTTGIINKIESTVNYARLYELLKAEMQKPRHLLETFAMEVAESIHLSFPQVNKVEISITKLHPPIPGIIGKVELKYSKEYQVKYN